MNGNGRIGVPGREVAGSGGGSSKPVKELAEIIGGLDSDTVNVLRSVTGLGLSVVDGKLCQTFKGG